MPHPRVRHICEHRGGILVAHTATLGADSRPKRRPIIPPRKTALRQARTAGVRGQSQKELIVNKEEA